MLFSRPSLFPSPRLRGEREKQNNLSSLSLTRTRPLSVHALSAAALACERERDRAPERENKREPRFSFLAAVAVLVRSARRSSLFSFSSPNPAAMSRFFRGGPGFAKPENALKRADELIAVGQKGAALRALHDVLSSKRHRAAWTKVLESVGLRYVELCVDLRKGRYAKDGLIHYRNVCQQVREEKKACDGS
jgi:hypothetical protein